MMDLFCGFMSLLHRHSCCKRTVSLIGAFVLVLIQFRLYWTLLCQEQEKSLILDRADFQQPRRQQQPKAISNNETRVIRKVNITQATPNRLYHVGQFGPGHRLNKLSAAFHLAQTFAEISELEIRWGSCKTDEMDVFTYLFGMNILSTRPASNNGKTILVRNDVHGYYAGQAYKNAGLAIPRYYRFDNRTSPWYGKIQSDRVLFQKLHDKFLERYPAVQTFTQSWSNHTVIGLHLRAGNGERHHFEQAARSILNQTEFVISLCQLLNDQPTPRPPLLFVATDTPDLIAVLQSHCQMPIAVFPQPRVSHGVSHSAWKRGKECFQGWLASMSDMALLASTDVLVAGMRSTFTQTMPLSLVMDKPGKQFCEVSRQGRTMTCWKSLSEWLFRDLQKSSTYSLDTVNATPVIHKLLVHLPDLVESDSLRQQVKAFLDSTTNNESVFVYGDRFNAKYRPKAETFREEWTWAEE